MVGQNLTRTDFEYDFERDELSVHRITSMKRLNVFTTIFMFVETNRSMTGFS